MNRRPHDQSDDLDRTDTLPKLELDADETGTMAMPHLPDKEPSQRLRVDDDLFSATDSFSAATLATPIAAKPVSVPDLAESLRERELRLVEAGRRVQELDAQLVQADERCAELEAQLVQADNRSAGLKASLARADERAAGVAVQLEHVASRCAELEQQCAELREAAAASSATPVVVAAQQGLLEEIAALRRTNGLLHESISSLHGRLGMHEAMLAEAEEALRSGAAVTVAPPVGSVADPDGAAEGHPAAIAEAPLLVDWPSRYAELETMLESERAAAASQLREQAGRLAALQARADAAPARTSVASHGPPAREAAVPMRVLIRMENGTESIYPLGRRTTIGRTPDNDIQINATYISRNHAVLLSSAGECIVEDLNSTNGLLVNGHRAGRQILQDGDTLTFGKARFRFETRS